MKLLSLATAGAAFLGGALAKKRNLFVYLNVYWDAQEKDICRQALLMADTGISHIILSFAEGNGNGFNIVDSALNWSMLSSDAQKSCLEQIHAKGSKLVLSFGGEHDHQSPWEIFEAKVYAKRAVDVALGDNYDGLDYDLEGIYTLGSKAVRDWFVDISVETRRLFNEAGKTDALVMHAPQGPYFGTWAGAERGFTDIAVRAGDAVDFYVVQYYNQGDCNYSTYERIFINSGCWSEYDAWQQIQTSIGDKHIADKVVVGKLASPDDTNAGTGYVEPATMAGFLCRAEKEIGYDGGIMFWSWKEHNDMPTRLAHYAVESCNPNSGPDPSEGPSDKPSDGPSEPTDPTTTTTKAPTDPTTTTTKAPTTPPTTTPAGPTTTRAPLQPGDYGCYHNKAGAWYPPCQSDEVCILGSEDEAACGEADTASSPFKVWTTSEYDCRMLTFHASFCGGMPVDPEPWTEVPAGGKGCFHSNTWWNQDCSSSDHCNFDGALKTEEFCIGGGQPNSVWVESEAACRAAIKNTGCSA